MITFSRPRHLAAIVGAVSLATTTYYRPVPDAKDGSGPRRYDRFFLSEENLNDHADRERPILYRLAQRVAILATVTVTRAFLYYGGKLNIIYDENYHNFLEKTLTRDPDVAIITVANHRSMFDDPSILSSLLPYHMNIQPKYLRWNVCAQEFCFSDKLPALIHAYIGAGKTLPIWRGGGIDQPLLHDFSRHVVMGQWLHIFPEAGVWQRTTLGGRSNGRESELGKLKWGIGKLIAHAPKRPILIPFFHTGMETVIPQDPITLKTKGLPIPRPGHNVTVKFGPEVRFDDLIAEHEKEYGPLWKYTESVDADKELAMKGLNYWESSETDKILYHKITLRIEKALTELNDQFYKQK